jgi:uncharacterized protein YigE (DUF2233 family)
MMWRCCLLLFVVVSAGEPIQVLSVAGADISRRDCESAYDGITYCVEDGGDIHVVVIDLNHPNIRFEMVMADDVTSVDTTHRERIEEMVARAAYQDQEIVIAVNADYFGQDHGPEGLTVKNGRRLDDDGGQRQNPYALWRSSLAISRLNRVSLGRKSAEELADPRAYRERFYNAVGGGPLILNHGVIIPNTVACLLERFPIGACRRTIQTAAGVSEDGRWLYLAVGEGRDIEGFARLLRDYGAFTAIKLDGGGSSQLWYDGRMRHDSERSVGNALLVLYNSVPRHDARFRSPVNFPVVEPGERVAIDFEIHNTGFLDWEPDLGYRFKNVQGWPVLGPAYQRLPKPIPAGRVLLSSLTINAPQRPGVYKAEWQLVRRAELIGPRQWFGVVVVPADGNGTALRAQIESRLAAWRSGPGFEREWPAVRQELERMIWREVENELRAALYGEESHGTQMGATMGLWWMPLPRPLPW